MQFVRSYPYPCNTSIDTITILWQFLSQFIKIYVFSEGRYAYDDDFKDVIGKITLCALPDAIYQAYRRVLPQRKKAQQPDAMVDDEEMKEALADAESYSYQEKKGGEA